MFDDINWSDGMGRSWAAIRADEHFALTVDLRSVGLAVVAGAPLRRRSLSVA